MNNVSDIYERFNRDSHTKLNRLDVNQKLINKLFDNRFETYDVFEKDINKRCVASYSDRIFRMISYQLLKENDLITYNIRHDFDSQSGYYIFSGYKRGKLSYEVPDFDILEENYGIESIENYFDNDIGKSSNNDFNAMCANLLISKEINIAKTKKKSRL